MGNISTRKGLRIKCEKNVNFEVRKAIINFAKWLRQQRDFPIRVPVYVKEAKEFKNIHGEMVVGTFFAPDEKYLEPYIKIASGDFLDLKAEYETYNALGMTLHTLAHEISHYDQWIKGKTLSCKKATKMATKLMDDYIEFLDIYQLDFDYDKIRLNCKKKK